MSKYFYEGHLNEQNSIVSYPYDKVEEYSLAQDYSLIKGFKIAADIIIQKMTLDKQVGHEYDNLVYPLLNMYVCMIEFSLKLTIKHLLNHISNGCEYLERPKSNKLEKLLNHSHDLKKLFKNLKDILSNKEKHPHSNLDLKFITKVIQTLKGNAVDVISTRYHYASTKDYYLLYQKQKNIRIFKLHEDIKKLIYMLLDYLKHEDFKLCELQFFTPWGLKKLREIERLSRESSELFRTLTPKKSYQDPSAGFLSISAIMQDLKPTHEEIKFFNEIRQFPTQKKKALLTCLYLAHHPLSQIHIENLSDTQLNEKIVESKYFYQPGVENLKQYISNIEQYH
ncbi:hypothetical protein ACQUW5_07310 [Legionella sp. CNM-1927-20]|uniref:hypothetical protein n=1 Tax=Legionella sp. CNM-1927-20 TaxID=3422221 RepID=UPI00403B2083